MQLYLATNNAHKVEEINAVLVATGLVQAVLRPECGMPKVVEDAPDFLGNAFLKSTALKQLLPPEAWVLADDSGLEVDALGGAPGVRSARYAGEHANDADNNAKLLVALKDVPSAQRTARFVCTLALEGPKGLRQSFRGTCEGRLLSVLQGSGGFGYDPLFVPNGYTETYATLGSDIKNRISHRAQALALLIAWLQKHAH